MPRTPASARLHDVAVLVPLLGLLLLMPPFITVFAVDLRPFGIPLLALYLFGVWAALIVAAALLARRVSKLEPAPQPSEEPAASTDAAAIGKTSGADAPGA